MIAHPVYGGILGPDTSERRTPYVLFFFKHLVVTWQRSNVILFSFHDGFACYGASGEKSCVWWSWPDTSAHNSTNLTKVLNYFRQTPFVHSRWSSMLLCNNTCQHFVNEPYGSAGTLSPVHRITRKARKMVAESKMERFEIDQLPFFGTRKKISHLNNLSRKHCEI